MSRNLKYDYHQFKKLYEEHDGNISRLAMLLSKERNTIRNWIKKMQRDDALIAECRNEVKRLTRELELASRK